MAAVPAFGIALIPLFLLETASSINWSSLTSSLYKDSNKTLETTTTSSSFENTDNESKNQSDERRDVVWTPSLSPASSYSSVTVTLLTSAPSAEEDENDDSFAARQEHQQQQQQGEGMGASSSTTATTQTTQTTQAPSASASASASDSNERGSSRIIRPSQKQEQPAQQQQEQQQVTPATSTSTATTTPTLTATPNNTPVDLEREKTRLESFESYVLVSILTASISFSVLEGADPMTLLERQDDVVYSCTILAAGISAVCGLHATIVFSLCVLYGKTALGMQRDECYRQFLQHVARARIRGFNSFSASLLLFAVECALLLYSHMMMLSQSHEQQWIYQIVALTLAIGSTYIIFSDWYSILEAAKQIFKVARPSMSTLLSKRQLDTLQEEGDEKEERNEEAEGKRE